MSSKKHYPPIHLNPNLDREAIRETLHQRRRVQIKDVFPEKVAERLGSTNRGPGVMPPPFHEHAVNLWGQTREQWRVNRQRLR